MTISARQILTTLGIALGLFLVATAWYGVFNGWVHRYCQGWEILQLLWAVVGVLVSSVAAMFTLVAGTIVLWDENPTIEFPRKPPLPRAVAKERK